MIRFDLAALLDAAGAQPSFGGGGGAGTSAPAGENSEVERLRLNLAVRGWVEPMKLVATGEAPEEVEQLLGALSPEVETAVETRPGQWYLTLPARSRELARCSDAALKTALRTVAPEDRDDPVLKAVRLAVGGDAPKLDTIEAPVLEALGQAQGWLAGHWNLAFDANQIANEIAARTLDGDLSRMTALPLVGAKHEEGLKTLLQFATGPATAPVSITYVYGGGGAGKTTLLAFLQRSLLGLAPPAAIARIDFDEPAIEATRTVTLNLALFEQLARTLPALAGRVSTMLPVLRGIALVQRAALAPGGRVSKTRGQGATLAQESIASGADSDEASILYGTLDPSIVAGPVVIILDTAELVLAQSDRVASSLAAWVNFLRLECRAEDLRLVIAGRDPPPDRDADTLAAENLLVRLERDGAHLAPAIPLPELTLDEAAELLRNCGVNDERVVASAAAAVPGNPLLLRITADALNQDDDDLRQSVLESHRHSQIDPASARNYLMRRIVAHVSDPVARPYVLTAMYSPVLSEAFFENVIIPAVDRNNAGASPAPPGEPADASANRAKAARVFRALASTYWLTRPTLDPKIIPFNRDIRAFALKLLASTGDSRALERGVRQAAEIFHLRRRSKLDRAMATYHAALLGHPFRLPRDVEAMRPLLRDVADELPAELRTWLAPGGTAYEEPKTLWIAGDGPAAKMSDADWLLYLEGDASREGEGMLLVNDDRASEALDMYRLRPTRPRGLPPTFVVRAIADVGEWTSDDVDVEAILDQESGQWLSTKAIGSDALTRLYWLTRLALFRPNVVLSGKHVQVLQTVLDRATVSSFPLLPGLLAVAEARMKRPIMPHRMRSEAQGLAEEGRILLVGPRLANAGPLNLAANIVAVTQRDWVSRVSQCARGLDISRLHGLQSRLEGLHGRPLAEVNQFFDKEREPVSFEWDGEDMNAGILLLRGQTTEFLRPLREALLTYCGDGKVGPRTRSLFTPILERMSIRPAEIEPEVFFERLSNNPRAWCSAFVSYADRSRLLPSLCNQLIALGNHGDGALPHLVATAFLAWDEALCRGGTSDWPDQPEPVLPA